MSRRSIIRTAGAVLLLRHDHAYKCFYGPGAVRRMKTEAARQARALACPVWGDHVVASQRVSRFVLRSRRGEPVSLARADEADRIRAFVDERLEQALAGGGPVPLIDLLDLDKIRQLLGAARFRAAYDRIEQASRGASLPGGPAHGDLHPGNIVMIDGRPRVIDCDRYTLRSSPLFDRIHFALSERQKESGGRWFDAMVENEDIALDTLRAADVDTATAAQLLLAYGLNRLAYDADDRRARRRSQRKYAGLAERLLDLYAPRAAPANESRAPLRPRLPGPRALRGSAVFRVAMRALWSARGLYGRKAERALLRLVNPRRRRFLPPRTEALDFFRRLEDRGIDYVLLRWSGDLFRLKVTQDIDVLVGDRWVRDVLGELSLWPVGRSVDLYSVSGVSGTTYCAKLVNGEKRQVPAFPSNAARQMLERRLRKDDLCFVPCPEHQLWSLAYHVTYLKGAASGLPLCSSAEPAPRATHDYAATLRELARAAGVTLDGEITRLRLADLLARQGWNAPPELTATLHAPHDAARRTVPSLAR